MAKKSWTVQVKGIVSRLREDGARVAVPTGSYSMTEKDFAQYELSRDGGPTLTLSLVEVSTYINEHQLKIQGTWP
jgi:hypothetical protein